ncbi:hypothetical protein ACFQH6_05975 [Halobacteriaceae archaeon GCM10025711]
MTTTLKLLAAALVALLVTAGLAAAAPGFTGQTNGPAGTGVAVADRPMDGSNSPWVTGDDRLDRFQDRFDLTDEQMETIRTAVVEQYESGATPAEMRATVTDLLAEFGVEDADLSPVMDRQRLQDGTGDGPARDGTGPRFGGQGHFGGQGQGPHGVMDGSCRA